MQGVFWRVIWWMKTYNLARAHAYTQACTQACTHADTCTNSTGSAYIRSIHMTFTHPLTGHSDEAHNHAILTFVKLNLHTELTRSCGKLDGLCGLKVRSILATELKTLQLSPHTRTNRTIAWWKSLNKKLDIWTKMAWEEVIRSINKLRPSHTHQQDIEMSCCCWVKLVR